MANRHAPGPWEATHNKWMGRFVIRYVRPWYEPGEDRSIATVLNSTDEQKDAANARLIAKAPEMLDLLVDALSNLDFAGGDDELTEDEREWRDRALALISALEAR